MTLLTLFWRLFLAPGQATCSDAVVTFAVGADVSATSAFALDAVVTGASVSDA